MLAAQRIRLGEKIKRRRKSLWALPPLRVAVKFTQEFAQRSAEGGPSAI